MSNVELVLGLLAVVAALAAVGKRVALPNPIVFALGGLILALIPGIPNIALPPDLVLVVFLPPLIYAAAQDTSWAEVRQNARPILFLAVGLVLATIGVVAVVFHAIVPHLSWGVAFTLGAIISPPDPIAAKAVADTLHLPRRVVAVLEDEGLFNDATALVAFGIASELVMTHGDFRWGASLLRFGYSSLVAIAIGLAIGWVGRRVLRQVGDPGAENTVTLLLPFAAYLPAEHVHASGVLAVLTLALYGSYIGVSAMSPSGRQAGWALWGMVDFLLTGLSFVLIGLQLRSVVAGLKDPPLVVVGVTAAVCLAVVVVRPLWVFATAWLFKRTQQALFPSSDMPHPQPSALAVVGWAGMRGVVSLAIALSLSDGRNGEPEFPGRDLIIFVTFAVILVTLLGQGLTLPLLIRRLGLTASEASEDRDVLTTQLHILQTALAHLDDLGDEAHCAPGAVERVKQFYETRVERLQQQCSQFVEDGEELSEESQVFAGTQELLQRLLKLEQKELFRLQRSGDIAPEARRRIQHNLDDMRVLALREGRRGTG